MIGTQFRTGDRVRTRGGQEGVVEWVGTGRYAGVVHVAYHGHVWHHRDYQLEKINEGDA